nr:MscL family protein [Gammaproteobacteria bacterium]
MKKLFKEFKEFISRGNVLDLAVGMIIGAAFTAIVTSLVNYVLKPLIAWIPLGNTDGFKTVLREAYINAEGVEVPELAIQWSEVISAI